MLERIKNFFQKLFSPYSYDSRQYNEKLIKKFEESDTDEVI